MTAGTGWGLGVDLGTTWTGAAVARDGRVSVVGLGNRSAAVPSVVLARRDGTVLIGEAAADRGVSEPGNVAREFKRRAGDPTPVLLDGVAWSTDALLAALLSRVRDQVTRQEGGPPEAIALTHPATWGPFKLDVLREAARQADVHEPVLIAEPVAAAAHYAALGRVADGATVAVFDLGGGTFDATVVRVEGGGATVLGRPDGVERLGGVDVDQVVLGHVVRALGDVVEDLDDDDPEVATHLARLREECVRAKENLSTATDVVIPVLLPGTSTSVRITRAELEAAIRPSLEAATAALARAIKSANVAEGGLDAVLLVGGSSRIPLVAEVVGGVIGVPIVTDSDPKASISLGAARLAGQAVEARRIAALPPEPSPADVAPTPTAATDEGAETAEGSGATVGVAPGPATGADHPGPTSGRAAAPGPAVPAAVPAWGRTGPTMSPEGPTARPADDSPPSPLVPALLALGLTAVALLLPFLGVVTPARSEVLADGAATVAGTDIGEEAADVDLAEPVEIRVSELPSEAAAADQVQLGLTIAGVPLVSSSIEPLVAVEGGFEAVVDADANRYLVAGEVTGQLRFLSGDDVVLRHDFALRPSGTGLLSVPGVLAVVLLLLVVGYAEAILRTLRQRRRKRSGVVSVAIVGAGAGLVALLISWLLGGVEPSIAVAIACMAVGAAAGGLAAVAAARAGRRRGRAALAKAPAIG